MIGLLLTTLAMPALAPHSSPEARTDRSERFALVIGYNAPPDESSQTLRYGDDDALATADLLRDVGAEVFVLAELDQETRDLHPALDGATPPTASNVYRVLESIRQRISAAAGRTEFYFYYSGHGQVENGEGYITLKDGRLTRGDLYNRILSRTGASTNHVFIDACKSYFLVFGRGRGGRRAAAPEDFSRLAESEAAHNTGFVLSTSSDRDSHEWERYRAGIFSHQMRSALRGGADTDGDRSVSYAELGAFLQTASAGIRSARYRPDYVVRAPGAAQGELGRAVVRWQPSNHVLEIDERVDHVYLEDGLGRRLLDVHPGPVQRVFLSLPAKRPLFLRAADERTEYKIPKRPRVRVSQLKRSRNTLRGKGSLHVAFKALFANPFSADNVTAFQRDYAADRLPWQQHAAVEQTVMQDESTLPAIAGWISIAAGGAALATGAWAVERSVRAGSANQVQRARMNDTVGVLRPIAIVAAGLSALTGGFWLTADYWLDDERSSTAAAGGVLEAGFSF